jgi:hypothetical protein
VQIDAIHAIMGFIVLFMMATTMGFFLCYFLMKTPPPPCPSRDVDEWLRQSVGDEEDNDSADI